MSIAVNINCSLLKALVDYAQDPLGLCKSEEIEEQTAEDLANRVIIYHPKKELYRIVSVFVLPILSAAFKQLDISTFTIVADSLAKIESKDLRLLMLIFNSLGRFDLVKQIEHSLRHPVITQKERLNITKSRLSFGQQKIITDVIDSVLDANKDGQKFRLGEWNRRTKIVQIRGLEDAGRLKFSYEKILYDNEALFVYEDFTPEEIQRMLRFVSLHYPEFQKFAVDCCEFAFHIREPESNRVVLQVTYQEIMEKMECVTPITYFSNEQRKEIRDYLEKQAMENLRLQQFEVYIGAYAAIIRTNDQDKKDVMIPYKKFLQACNSQSLKQGDL
ncbi:MAG: hypothetical protein FJZ56_05065 [Chlamydiae bacterium]|nr:hypothetical protein [Chlamydiota bacterium]